MNRRLQYLLAIVVILFCSVAINLSQPQTAAAATDYYYTNDSYNAVQGPNPFRVADQSENVTYRKVNDSSQSYGFGNGVYLALGSPRPDNAGGTCYPAIQTASKRYDGNTNAKLYLECGTAGHSNPRQQSSITVSETRPFGTGSGVNANQRQVFDYALCPAVKNLDDQLYKDVCLLSYASQSDQDAAAKKICDKYPSQLQEQCDDYKNKTFNEANTLEGGDEAVACEQEGGDLGWILCPVYDAVQGVASWMLDELISPLLYTNPLCLDTTGNSCNDTIYRIWSSFRIYGNIFLVLALLIIVFGESIGGGLIDAYTAKKILPRLLVAAVLINLSIYIVALLIDITNVIGGGIGQLLTAPLREQGAFEITPTGITPAAAAGAGFLGLAAGGVLLGFGGGALLLVGLVITGAIAIVGVFVTLILRQVIIIGLVLVSPVAFALWCIPNTAQWFKRWWDLLFQMLLVYPIIIAIFAVASILSAITSESTGGGNALATVISFLLLVIPLYLIPFVLRSSNRILGAVQGAASNVGRQLNAVTGRKAIGAAGQVAAKNLQRSSSNTRFNPNSKYLGGINKRTNTALSNIMNPGVAAKIYGGSALNKLGVQNSMGKGIMNSIEETQLQHSTKLGERLNQLGFNDRALRTLMKMDDYSAGSIRQEAAKLAVSENPNDRLAANQLNSSAAFLGQTLYQDEEMGKADVGIAAGLAVTAQGFSNSQEVADLANRKRGQGSGLATAFVTQAQLNGQRAGMLDMKAGYGVQIGEDGKFFGTGVKVAESGGVDQAALQNMSIEERNRAIAHQIKRISTTGSQEISSAKGGSLAAMAPGFQQILQAASGPVNPDTGNYEFHYQNEQGGQEKVEISPQEVQRVTTMLGSAQSAFSATSPSTSNEIQKIYEGAKPHMSDELKNAYNQGRRDINPTDPFGQGASPDEQQGDKK